MQRNFLPSPYSEFIFDGYEWDPAPGSLLLRYRFAGGPSFEERLDFEVPPRPLPPAAVAALDRVFRLIFLFCGVSYYKAFVPPVLRCAAFSLDGETARFLGRFYRKGLAEFVFRNAIALDDGCRFLSEPVAPLAPLALDLPRRTCVPVGGGKDSVVSVECLKQAGEPLVLFSLGDAEPIRACIAAADLPFFRVRRRLDAALLRLNAAGALNGHVPITGILSAVALAGAVLLGYDAIAMSNEHSASAANLKIGNREINHQYSKSFEFEQDFAKYVAAHISPDITYFSLLRPFSEIEIARRFSQYRRYFPLFRSCNTAFRQVTAERGRSWCGDCPKCRFVFLALTPFVGKSELARIFGRDLFADPAQFPGFAALCGFGAHKPFECVGEIAESAAVMAHLGNDPAWREAPVVRQMLDAFPSLRRSDPARYQAVFATRAPHRVPERYLAMLDACG
jgi:UDP-N-acetyl-alpha-D-muramoyl-L-alanyl-L-glutamate epimerase